MRRRWAFVVALVWLVLVAVALAVMSPSAAPIKRGTAGVFWWFACGVDLEGKRPQLIGQYRGLREGWLYYTVSHMHGSELYRLPYDEASRLFDQVLQAVQAKGDDLPQRVKEGLEHWRARQGGGIAALLDEIQKARLDRYAVEDASLYAFAFEEQSLFEQRLRRAKWYWATIGFEWCLLSGIGWLVLWPAMRRLRPWRCALHIGLAPVLFYLPVYLGYATLTFTSAGPSGGIVYPWLVVWMPRPEVNDWDRVILDYLPQVLEPLSQPIGTPLALTGMGFPSPTAVVGAGLVLGLAAFLGRRIVAARHAFMSLQRRAMRPKM